MTRYFIDTEFGEDGHTIDLISIALVREDGHELYLCSTEARLDRVNDWVRANVLPKLPPYDSPLWRSRPQIRSAVNQFIGSGVPEFWGSYCDYDWVVFCQLFGRMIDLPSHWPKYCRDLKQWSDDLGDPPRMKQLREHDALEDARWNRDRYIQLDALAKSHNGSG